MIVLAQAGVLGLLVHVLIVAIIIAAIIYVAQLVIPVPQPIVQIVWIIFIVVLAIFALRFLAAQL